MRKYTALIAALMVAVGAVLSSAVQYMLFESGANWSMTALVRSPIGWAVGPNPVRWISVLLAFVLLVGATWWFVSLVLRSAIPGRAAAVFFGTWGAIVVAAIIVGMVRAPLFMLLLIPPGASVPFENQLAQFTGVFWEPATWVVAWGWLTALVTAILHKFTTQASQSSPPVPQSASASIPAPPTVG